MGTVYACWSPHLLVRNFYSLTDKKTFPVFVYLVRLLGFQDESYCES